MDFHAEGSSMLIRAKTMRSEAVIAGLLLIIILRIFSCAAMVAAEESAQHIVGAEKKGDSGSETVISLNSYWRYWLTARPAELEEPYVDRRGRKITALLTSRGWHIGKKARPVITQGPPEGWEKPEFSDSSWPVDRNPQGTGRFSLWGLPYEFRRWSGRTRFIVPDPSSVKSLKLYIRYRGGIRVFVNGNEIARQHLPEGRLDSTAFGQGYPESAYGPADKEEMKEGRKQKLCHKGCWKTYAEVYENNKAFTDSRPLMATILKRRRRTLDIEIPLKSLKKGVNLLAVDLWEAGISKTALRWGFSHCPLQARTWELLKIRDLKMSADPSGSALPVAPSQGIRVWAEDIHRQLFNVDFPEPDVKSSAVRIVGVRGGMFSGQAVLRTGDAAVQGLKASVTALQGPGDSLIQPDNITILYGVPQTLSNVQKSYGGKKTWARYMIHTAVERHADTAGLNRHEKEAKIRKAKEEICIIDRLSAAPPETVPGNMCQNIWIRVAVPDNAKQGLYRGTVSIEGRSAGKHSLDVRLMVFDLRLSPPQSWHTFTALEMTPYAVSDVYGLELWEEAHWKKTEECFALLGALGNNAVQVPLITDTEMGNDESMVAWVKQDEGYSYDWMVLDRYLGLARKYYGKPLAIAAHVHPAFGLEKAQKKLKVTILEQGKKKAVELDLPGTEGFRNKFLPFAQAFAAHVKEKNLADSIHWGFFLDWLTPSHRKLAEDLISVLPEIGWMRVSHLGNRNNPFPKKSRMRVDFDSHIRWFTEPDWSKGGVGRMGWNQDQINLLYPRAASEITAIAAYAPLWHMRELGELSITSTARGYARLMTNLWDSSLIKVKPGEGRKKLSYLEAKMGWFAPAVRYILYPGEENVEAGVQYEIMREGLQECEARIMIEKKNPSNPVLLRRTGAAWLLPGGSHAARTGEFYGGWQTRSWDLFREAAEASGGQVPGDGEKDTFFSEE